LTQFPTGKKPESEYVTLPAMGSMLSLPVGDMPVEGGSISCITGPRFGRLPKFEVRTGCVSLRICRIPLSWSSSL